MKKILVALLAIVIGLTLAACGGTTPGNTSSNGGGSGTGTNTGTSSGDNTGADDGNKEQIEIRFAWWGNAARSELYNQILDIYEAENTHVKIIREAADWGDYWQKLATQASTSSLPDIFGVHILLYGGEYASKNVLEPLQSYVDSGLISFDGWDQAIIDAGKIDGTLYAVPKGITLNGLIVNVSMLQEVGMEVPKNGMNYDELIAYMNELKSKLPDGKYAMVDASYDDHMFETFMRQKGKSVLTPDGSALGFEPQDLMEFWTIWEDFRQAGVIPTAALTAEHRGVPAENSMFAKQQLAIDAKPTNHGKIYSRILEDSEMAIVRWPVMQDGKFLGGENLQAPSMVMYNNSKHKEEAAKLMNWFVNNVDAQKIYNLENGIPGSKTIQDALKEGLHPMDVQAIDHLASVTPDIPPTTYRPAGASQVFTTYTNYLDQLAFGRMSIEDAVNGFFAEVDTFLGN